MEQINQVLTHHNSQRWQVCAIVKAVLSRFVQTLHQGPFLAVRTSFYGLRPFLTAALAASFDIHMHLDFILYDQGQPFL
jgi:hypothetical protein